MTRKNASNARPKIHNIRRLISEEIYHLVYSKDDKDIRKEKIEEIEQWLSEMGFLGNETPIELAREWREHDFNRGQNQEDE